MDEKIWGMRAAGMLMLLWCLLFPATACGKTFRVGSRYDITDLEPGNGLCVAYLVVSPPYVIPFCTLRGAVEEANALSGDDVIMLSTGTYTLDIDGRNEQEAHSGDLDVTESLTITGNGAELTFIDAAEIDRVFDVVGEDTRLILKDLTLLNGSVGTEGGGVRNKGRLDLVNVVVKDSETTDDAADGGLVYNSGDCYAKSSTFQGGTAESGGGIFNASTGEMALTAVTLSENDAANGAGIYNDGSLLITNTTISGNGSEVTRTGGGIENHGALQLQHATIAANAADFGGGCANSGIFTLQNTILADNRGNDCGLWRQSSSSGYNIDTDASCGLDGKQDLSVSDAGLMALAASGGSTQTHNLNFTSPARDSGFAVSTVTVDQRGRKRPFGRAVDRGAVECTISIVAPQILLLGQ